VPTVNRRLLVLLGVVVGLAWLVAVEWALFSTLHPKRAVFLQIAVLGVATALGTVLARNLVHAALYLVAFFFLVACLFVMLEAEFLAAMQVLVYIGAVAILMMFGIMLTRNIQGDETTSVPWMRKLPAAIVALGLFGMIAYGVAEQQGPETNRTWSAMLPAPTRDRETGQPNERAAAINDMARVLGRELMTRWAVPFEVAGLLLTAAVVGAVALARVELREEPPTGRARRAVGASGDGNGDAGHPEAERPEAVAAGR
jgi:NADH:ubiquinone oxidoreductase subunit 6 (subunit J)